MVRDLLPVRARFAERVLESLQSEKCEFFKYAVRQASKQTSEIIGGKGSAKKAFLCTRDGIGAGRHCQPRLTVK